MKTKIRKGLKSDLPIVLDMIKELADYEKSLDSVEITLEQLQRDGFGERPFYWFLIAEDNKEIVGLSFYHIRYSTWKGKFLFLEDFVVKKKHRNKGIGSLLFEETIKVCKTKKLNGVVWQVLNWNKAAIKFYKKYEAEISSDWLNGKLSKKQIMEFSQI